MAGMYWLNKMAVHMLETESVSTQVQKSIPDSCGGVILGGRVMSYRCPLQH
jgi:hypothetical protein